MHACDGRTDGQTDRRNWRDIYALWHICCRAKNLITKGVVTGIIGLQYESRTTCRYVPCLLADNRLSLGTCYGHSTQQTQNQRRFTISEWHLIGASWWYRGASCGHQLPAIANNIGPAVQHDRYTTTCAQSQTESHQGGLATLRAIGFTLFHGLLLASPYRPLLIFSPCLSFSFFLPFSSLPLEVGSLNTVSGGERRKLLGAKSGPEPQRKSNLMHLALQSDICGHFTNIPEN